MRGDVVQTVERLTRLEPERSAAEQDVAKRKRPLVGDRTIELGEDGRLVRTHALGEPPVAFGAGEHRWGQRAVDRSEMLGLLQIEPECLRAWEHFVAHVRPQIAQVAARQRPDPRGCRFSLVKMPEFPGYEVADFFGNRPIAGDLAADHRHDARHAVPPTMIVQGVLAGDFAFVDVLDAHQGANACPGVVHLVEPAGRKRMPGFFDQVVDVRLGRGGLGRIAAVVGVGRPDQRVAQPRDDEKQPSVPPGEQHVGVFGSPRASRGARLW